MYRDRCPWRPDFSFIQGGALFVAVAGAEPNTFEVEVYADEASFASAFCTVR